MAVPVPECVELARTVVFGLGFTMIGTLGEPDVVLVPEPALVVGAVVVTRGAVVLTVVGAVVVALGGVVLTVVGRRVVADPFVCAEPETRTWPEARTLGRGGATGVTFTCTRRVVRTRAGRVVTVALASTSRVSAGATYTAAGRSERARQ